MFQVYMFAGLEVYKSIGLEVYKPTGLQVYRSTDLQVYKFQINMFAGLQNYFMTSLVLFFSVQRIHNHTKIIVFLLE